MSRDGASRLVTAFLRSGAVLLLSAAALGGPPAHGKPASRNDLRKWLDGPVRYIVTEDEIRVFHALSADDARTDFIDRFWARRDPSPETGENEYRALFWSRVKYANERFADSALPGWKTDRGKLYVLCGEPSRIEDDTRADSHDSATAGRGVIRWIYEGRPCGRQDMGSMVIVPFVRQTTGEYHLSYDPKLTSLQWDPNAVRDEVGQQIARWIDFIAPSDRSSLQVMADLGRLQEAPHPEQIVIERVETAETYGSHPLIAAVGRFRHPRGGTLLVVTVAAAQEPSAKPTSFIARISPRDPAKTKRYLTEESFRLEGSGADRIAQARIVVDPGSWDVTVLSSEPGSTTNGIYQGRVEVPAPAEGIAMSDVVFAREIEPAAYAALATHDEPYRIGPFRVVPKLGSTVRRGEPLTIFFEVYGATAPFRVEYRIEGREDDGRYTPLGHPSIREDAEGAQGWSVTTSPAWPTGEYLLRIQVQDPAGGSVEALVPFTLE